MCFPVLHRDLGQSFGNWLLNWECPRLGCREHPIMVVMMGGGEQSARVWVFLHG